MTHLFSVFEEKGKELVQLRLNRDQLVGAFRVHPDRLDAFNRHRFIVNPEDISFTKPCHGFFKPHGLVRVVGPIGVMELMQQIRIVGDG